MKEIEPLLTNKQGNNRNNLNYLPLISDNSGNLLKTCFFRIAVFVYFGRYIGKISLFSNSERNILVAPWSSFQVFKVILSTKQSPADVLQNSCS